MLTIILCTLLLHHVVSELFTVQTSRGAVQGFDQDLGNDTSQTFYGYGQLFLGIPFAKPPLGERRFQLPEPLCQYNDRGEVHNATYYRQMCWQIYGNVEKMSEDCLYLNVMTPNITGKYPVMVYIHGGTFTTGSAEKYHWKGAIRNLVSRGVVVVTIQYRLSALGFFTTFTDVFPPNRGMFDQILALRWVNEEISNFGGDSNRITIFGQSAGAASVSDLSLSPLARGLFHQLIQTSGSTLGEIETIEDPRWSIHQDLAQQICNINSSNWGSRETDKALLDCFQNSNPNYLVAFDENCFESNICWNVAIDGAILPDYPENLAKTRPRYPVLTGHMLEDFAFFIPGYQDGDFSNITGQTNVELFQKSWPNFDDQAGNVSNLMICGYYDGNIPADDDHMGWAKAITEMYTGLLYSSFITRDVQWNRNVGNENLWLFTFAYRSMLSSPVDIEGWIPVAHMSELPYLWFYPDIWETYNASESDFAVAEYMGGLWTQFAKNGELPLPRVGESMNYVEISEFLTLKRNWQAKADVVFNQELPNLLGEWPPLKMSDASWMKINELGKKVLSKWKPTECIGNPSVTTTTKSASIISTVSVSVTLLKLCFNM